MKPHQALGHSFMGLRKQESKSRGKSSETLSDEPSKLSKMRVYPAAIKVEKDAYLKLKEKLPTLEKWKSSVYKSIGIGKNSTSESLPPIIAPNSRNSSKIQKVRIRVA
jgi:hypothetical protein